jgi:hypothetical protein
MDFFKNKGIITKKDIASFFEENGTSSKDNTLNVKIYRLKEAGLIKNMKRGFFTVSDKKIWQFPDNPVIRKICRKFVLEYPEIEYCMWSTEWLHDYMRHQPFQSYYVFETEKDIAESVFYLFKEQKINAYFLPDEKMLTRYATGEKNIVIVKNLVSRSPIVSNNKVNYPSIEKILVDAFIDKTLFSYLQGTELVNIYKTVFSLFLINYSKLLNYADRRGQKQNIIQFIANYISENEINNIL